MSEQRPLTADISQDNLFRSLQENSRGERILRLTAPRNLRALMMISILVFLMGTFAVSLVIAQRNYERSSVRVEILSRLLANEVQQDMQQLEPHLIQMGRAASDAMVIADVLPDALNRGRRNLAQILSSTKALAVAAVDARGKVVMEAGSIAAAPLLPSLPELQRLDNPRKQEAFAAFDEARQMADGRFVLPLTVRLNDPRMGLAYTAASGYLVLLMPESAIAKTLDAFLPDRDRYAAFLIEPEGRVLASTRKGDPALPEPRSTFATEELQGARSFFLDQDVSVFAAKIEDRKPQGLGSEWVGAFAAIPGQQLNVMVLDATDPVTLVLSEGSTLVFLAIIPALLVIGLFSYVVVNTWLTQDDRVRDLQSWVSRYRVATNMLRSGLIEWFPNEGDVMLAGSWKALLGYRNPEIANEIDQWFERIHPDDRDRVMNRLQGLMDAKMLRSEQRYRLEDREGGYLDIIERAAVELWPNGQVRRVILVHSVDDHSAAHIGEPPPRPRSRPARRV